MQSRLEKSYSYSILKINVITTTVDDYYYYSIDGAMRKHSLTSLCGPGSILILALRKMG